MASVIERVGDLDESQIIDRIQRFLCGTVHTEVGVGDDAAVVRAPDGRVVVSTDALVEGIISAGSGRVRGMWGGGLGLKTLLTLLRWGRLLHPWWSRWGCRVTPRFSG